MLRLSAVAAVLRLVIDSQGVLAPGFLQEFLAMYLLIALGVVLAALLGGDVLLLL